MIDTPGIRRRQDPRDPLETLSVSRSFQALGSAQVILALVDARVGLERQDLRLARWSADQGRALIWVLNKIDQVANQKLIVEKTRDALKSALPQANVIPISALYGKGIDALMRGVVDVYQTWNSRIPTSDLNQWIKGSLRLPTVRGTPLKILYMTQAKRRPPTFILWLNRDRSLPQSYRRYLINRLRQDFALDGIPLRLLSRCTRRPWWSQPGSNR